jgi:hypothetical protein
VPRGWAVNRSIGSYDPLLLLPDVNRRSIGSRDLLLLLPDVNPGRESSLHRVA